MVTKRATATAKEAASDTDDNGELTNLERIEALEARIDKLERAMAIGGAVAKSMFRNAQGDVA